MKSPDEFHYGFEEPGKPRENIVCECGICGRVILRDDFVVTVEIPGRGEWRAHERCWFALRQMTFDDAVSSLGIETGQCKGYELEEE
jgi:hypothetical protein